jgi:DNA-binding LacI/PurR family transcriptional regulator
LRRQRTEKIGFLFSFPVTTISEYIARLITGVVIAAEQESYNLVLYPLKDDPLEQLTRICRAREVDGLLLLARAQIDPAISLLEKESVPFVLVGRRFEQPHISFITPDFVDGARQVTRHLLALGHRRIAYTTRPALGITSRDRLEGYRQTLAEAGIPFDPQLVVETTTQPNSSYQAMNRLLDLPNPPTAVFAIHDLVALECLQAAADRHCRVPDDVAIVGFDDWSMSLTTQPPLTTVRTPLYEMGRQATHTLLNHVTEPDLPAVQTILPVELVVRQSTAGSSPV